MLRSDYVKQE